MNINNPRIHPKTGYYNSYNWENGPYLIIFNPSSKFNEFIVDYDRKYTYKTPYQIICKECINGNYYISNDNSTLHPNLIWIGKTL